MVSFFKSNSKIHLYRKKVTQVCLSTQIDHTLCTWLGATTGFLAAFWDVEVEDNGASSSMSDRWAGKGIPGTIELLLPFLPLKACPPWPPAAIWPGEASLPGWAWCCGSTWWRLYGEEWDECMWVGWSELSRVRGRACYKQTNKHKLRWKFCYVKPGNSLTQNN